MLRKKILILTVFFLFIKYNYKIIKYNLLSLYFAIIANNILERWSLIDCSILFKKYVINSIEIFQIFLTAYHLIYFLWT